MTVLMTPAYVAMMESTTQARKTRASLLTYLQIERRINASLVRCCLCVCLFVRGYLLHPDKHNQCHQDQAACSVDTHIVGHC